MFVCFILFCFGDDDEGDYFFIYFSEYSLLVYKKAADFPMFILYPVTQLKEPITSDSFLVAYSGSLK